jgi:hypothetical protein
MRGKMLITILSFFAMIFCLVYLVFRDFKTEIFCSEEIDQDSLGENRIFYENFNDVIIFFGHQSVGQDIVLGMQEIKEDDQQSTPDILERSILDDIQSGSLIHCKIGRNTRPISKIKAFKRALRSAAGEKVDIALMKFCYVDITSDSNPTEIFVNYSEAISELRSEFPETIFVHLTVPIVAMPQSAEGVVKQFVKRVIGRPGVIEDNWVRHQYNVLLRDHYSGREPVFDLAAFEAVDSRGCSTVRMFKGEKILFMDPEKTEDGGHLNRYGRRTIGRELLAFLSGVARGREIRD